MPVMPPPRARTSELVACVLALACALALIWGVLFQRHEVYAVFVATRGLIQPTFVAALLIAVLAGGVLRALGVGRAMLGLTARDVPVAAGVLAIGYLAIQLGLAIAARGIAPTGGDPGVVIGGVIAQLFGTALVEEVVFRGFLLRQLVLRHGLAAGVALASLAFALWHVPQRMSLGLTGFDLVASLAVVWIGGVLAAWLYLRSGNLLLVVVLHALFNDSAPLVAAPISPQWILGCYVVGVLIWIERSQHEQLLPRGLARLGRGEQHERRPDDAAE